MCLIVFAYNTHPDYKLILAANRDEFYDRPTTTADWWEDHPNILGGRDLKAKGTWMGVDKRGRFAAVTNYRDISGIREDVKSRGDLPVDFLLNGHSSTVYSEQVLKNADKYNGFNLLALDEEMTHLSNYENKVNRLDSGIYGLSNALLDTSWPKVEKAKDHFKGKIASDFELQDLISLMQDEGVAEDDALPQTGLPVDMERAVSAMCIRTPNYGTCCSTAITIDYDGHVEFEEKSYPVGNREDKTVRHSFQIENC
ncbi:MAG: NRDE family protein [Cyclobacteriaceae bacterium]